MTRDNQYKIAHYICQNFLHFGIPLFNTHEIVQLGLAGIVKRHLNMLSYGKFYKILVEVCMLYVGEGRILRGGEHHTTMMCGGCQNPNEFVGSSRDFLCRFPECPHHNIIMSRDGNAARNIFMKMRLNLDFPESHECFQRDENIDLVSCAAEEI